MDARDELRAALEGQQAEENVAANAQREHNIEREAYEQKETETIGRLQQMADLVLVELNQRAEAKPVALNPRQSAVRHLLGSRSEDGWDITLERHGRPYRHILRPDGYLLITPETKRHSKSPPPEYTTLGGWVQWQVQGRRTSLSAAFGFASATQGPIQYSGSPKAELESALSSKELLVKNTLARILRSQGVPELS